MNSPYSTASRPLDHAAIRRWNAEIVRAREEYAAHLFEHQADEAPYCIGLGCWEFRVKGSRCEECHYVNQCAKAHRYAEKQQRYRDRKKAS